MEEVELPAPCLVSLSQLAYSRAANADPEQWPRFRTYVSEMEKTAGDIAAVLRKNGIIDEQVRIILAFYKVI
jgi:hypothetical protein